MTLTAHNISPSADALGEFIQAAAAVSGIGAEIIDRLCTRIGVPRNPEQWRSTLNNDGSPIQLCIGLRSGSSRPNVRVIADPHVAGRDPWSRAARSRAALARLAQWHAEDLAGLCASVLARMTPSGCDTAYLRDGGDVWLAAGTDGRGVAVYATARWGEAASRWPRALAWLLDIAPAAAQTIAALAELTAHTSLISVGIEGSTASDARAKFYWRPSGSSSLAGLGVPLLMHEALRAFLSETTQGMATPASAIVGSVSIDLATGLLADAKFDLCGHCVPRSRMDWASRIDGYARRYGLTPLPLAALARSAPVEIAFVGMGIDRESRPRLNVYLKPASVGDQP